MYIGAALDNHKKRSDPHLSEPNKGMSDSSAFLLLKLTLSVHLSGALTLQNYKVYGVYLVDHARFRPSHLYKPRETLEVKICMCH
jgi:hypothetical protein